MEQLNQIIFHFPPIEGEREKKNFPPTKVNLKPNDLINTYRLRHKKFILRYLSDENIIFRSFTKLLLCQCTFVCIIKAPHLFAKSVVEEQQLFYSYFPRLHSKTRLLAAYQYICNLYRFNRRFLNEKLNEVKFHESLVFSFRP